MEADQSQLPLIIILLGPPGSGKGTQAQLLAKEFHLPHISTGDIFREHISKETPLGLKVKEIIKSGGYVSDDITIEMVKDRISQKDCQNGFILDGFPRTVYQAEQFIQSCPDARAILVLGLDVSDDVIVNRAASRIVCKKCGSVYNAEIDPPQNEEICDKCDGELHRREDDRPEVVTSRLNIYRELTQPLIAFFDDRNLLSTFEGDQPRDNLLKELVDHIRENHPHFTDNQ